ncbi:MAG: DEAD/DEAH box helicase [Shewanella sp.]|nr:DEAD/DEAH box helicase [Shewanella sp.]
MPTSLLSALPIFLHHADFWHGLFNLKQTSEYDSLKRISASHHWAINGASSVFKVDGAFRHVIGIAQGLLTRGQWTLPSWRLEQDLAQRFQEDLGWQMTAINPDTELRYYIQSKTLDTAFKQALVSARWPCEYDQSGHDILTAWHEFPESLRGSAAELRFLTDVLIPVLGYPLLDYLQLQPELTSLGLNPQQFAQQRTDFAINTERGERRIKLVLEIDGQQHQAAQQQQLDQQRDKALAHAGWHIWRIRTHELNDCLHLQQQLKEKLGTQWGHKPLIEIPRTRKLLSCVWGATVSARLQFLLLEALLKGVIGWQPNLSIAVIEHETDIAASAFTDFNDWFGRLCLLYGTQAPTFCIAPITDTVDLVLDISVLRPYCPTSPHTAPVAYSRPANSLATPHVLTTDTRQFLHQAPDEILIRRFTQDILRKPDLREGQYAIISRILQGQDVIGLLPTGGGKSLTYQLAGLLMAGMTIYVSPLKSLMQDQRERLQGLGLDAIAEISSAQSMDAKLEARQQLNAGSLRFLLISPERFLIESFRQDLATFTSSFGHVCQVVIDECHCVSEWGHEFRPAYLSLSRIVKERTERMNVSAPLVALTGTASSIVLSDVRRELGVREDEAIIRAKRLDRPEIQLKAFTLAQTQKVQALQNIVSGKLPSLNPQEGILVFTRYVNGKAGTAMLHHLLSRSIDHSNLRLYCGDAPNWQKLRSLSNYGSRSPQTTEALTPAWVQAQGWEQTKKQNQSDFISGLPNSFQVLVATHAFGMGIDKPAIRQVIHYICPPSPEAYYQEVGRAGRDKQQSEALLLFSDEYSDIVDKLLDPGIGVEEAHSIYQQFNIEHPYQGGDFIQTYFFHQNTFKGAKQEANCAIQLLNEIRQKQHQKQALLFGFSTATETDNKEYSLVRLIILGVVKDYTKDYNSKKFSLALEADWLALKDQPDKLAHYLAQKIQHYTQRYHVLVNTELTQQILSQTTCAEIEAVALHQLLAYVYDKIERRRRQASRQMLELARKAVSDADAFKQNLLLYLQASDKFTQELEQLALHIDWQPSHALLLRVDNPDELKELHGAAQRVLESYPTHPSLLLLSAITRSIVNITDQQRSQEELEASFKYWLQHQHSHSAMINIAEQCLDYCQATNNPLHDPLEQVFGLWLLDHDHTDKALKQFAHQAPVRHYWLNKTLNKINQLPLPEEI